VVNKLGRYAGYFAGAAFVVIELFARSSAYTSNFEQRLLNLDAPPSIRQHLSSRKMADAVKKKYVSSFRRYQHPETLHGIPERDVRILFQAATVTAFYTNDPNIVLDMERDYRELSRRHFASAADAAELFSAYLADRQFEKARTLWRHNRALDTGTVPRYVDESHLGKMGPTQLDWVSSANTVVRRDVVLNQPLKIIVMSSPLCHFCQRAVREIEKDSTLRRVFYKRALWLEVPDGNVSLRELDNWNRHHAHQHMALVYRLQEWNVVDDWETPTFYVFRHGKLATKVVGWHGDAALEKALQLPFTGSAPSGA